MRYGFNTYTRPPRGACLLLAIFFGMLAGLIHMLYRDWRMILSVWGF